jgi:hypothetical protein
MNELFEEQLRETYAEHDASYDPGDAAERVRARLADTATRQRRPTLPKVGLRTRAWLGLGAAVTACGLALVVLLTGNRPGAISPERRVVALTAAYVTGSGRGVLHLEATTSSTLNGKSGSFVVDNWSDEGPPYDYWVGSGTKSGKLSIETTVVGNTITTYQADWNQISIGNSRTGPVPGVAVDPLFSSIVMLVSPGHGIRLPVPTRSHTVDSPKIFKEMLAALAKEPGVTVNDNATLNGMPAIRFRSARRGSDLYVEPGTDRPLEFTLKGTVSHKGKSWTRSITTRFTTYESLPSGSLHMPNLITEYPHALVPAWDRKYWNKTVGSRP